jgi:two-component system, chemotaxis family, chemotaxis protein CheY
MHIMIIDDDEDFREVLSLVLEMQGHQVETAGEGLEALMRLRDRSRPALILLDMMMPRLDGEAFMRAMRSDSRMPAIPVVVISGHHAAEQKAADLGAVACLVKPVELAQLSALVRDLEERMQSSSAVGPPSA